MITRRLFLISVVSLLSFSVYSQKVANKQFTLLDYDLTISKEIAKEISSLESYIDNIKTYNDPGNNKLEAILVHIIYFTLKEKFEEQLMMEILPINTFLRKVKYDDYGYPKTTIRDALKKGYSKYYFKLETNLESLTEKTTKEDTLMYKDIDYPTIFPQLTIQITLYNKDGVLPVDKWNGTSEARYPLPINEYLLKGFDNTQMEVLPLDDNQDDNLFLILDRAIQNVIQDYHNK
jgi:hypothetical protein